MNSPNENEPLIDPPIETIRRLCERNRFLPSEPAWLWEPNLLAMRSDG